MQNQHYTFFKTPLPVQSTLDFQLFFVLRDIKRKAKRWDTKQVDGLKKKRDQYVKELKDLQVERRKDSNLQDLKSQISGLDHRLRYTQTDKETIV